MKLYRQALAVYKTQYHLVWVTRYQRNILVPEVAEYLKKVLPSVERDHVRVIPPTYAVSKVVETLKSVTSRRPKG